MQSTRYEEYGGMPDGLPFVLNTDLKRSRLNRSRESNWHDELEIQLCTSGVGSVILDGKEYKLCENDIAVVNPNVIHYTGSDEEMTYSCVIISSNFCADFLQSGCEYSPIIKSERLAYLIKLLESEYESEKPLREARTVCVLLSVLIELDKHRTVEKSANGKSADSEISAVIKRTILYIRENYDKKLTLDIISKAVLYDKYALCRKFKLLTGRTVVQYINKYRCLMAIERMNEGLTVSQAAFSCGFENLSYFTKCFKRYVGRLPSEGSG